MLETIIILCVSSGMSLLSGYIGVRYAGKKLINEAEERVFGYLESQEGMETFVKLGACLGQGAITQIKGNLPTDKPLKIAGFNIPRFVINAILAKMGIGQQSPQGEQIGRFT